MALSRCNQCGKPLSTKITYIGYVYPVGYPDTALICGKVDCGNPGVIWVIQSEMNNFNRNNPVFSGPTNMAKMKADIQQGYKLAP